jgi:hypothetical protein
VLPQAEAKGSMFFPWAARNAGLAIPNFGRICEKKQFVLRRN